MCLLSLFQINLQSPLNMRVSYNDYKLYLSILDSVSKQLNKAIKTDETNSKLRDQIPEHNFDGNQRVVVLLKRFIISFAKTN